MNTHTVTPLKFMSAGQYALIPLSLSPPVSSDTGRRGSPDAAGGRRSVCGVGDIQEQRAGEEGKGHGAGRHPLQRSSDTRQSQRRAWRSHGK